MIQQFRKPVIERLIIFFTFFFVAIILLSSYRNYAQVNGPNEDQDPKPEVLSKIRTDFYSAIEDDDINEKLASYIEEIYSKNEESYPAIIMAYYGGIETLKAKHSYNPYNKFRYVISGIKMLNKAVEKSPFSLEVRFLRFSVLHHIPGIFGVSNEREDDLNTIYSLLQKKDYTLIDKNLQRGVAQFLLDSNRLSQIQTEGLQKLYPDITAESN